jgi:hypothetical protein
VRAGLHEQHVDQDGYRDEGAEDETYGIPHPPTQRSQ